VKFKYIRTQDDFVVVVGSYVQIIFFCCW